MSTSSVTETPVRTSLRLPVAGAAYVLMLVAAVGAFLLIREAGEGLTAPEIPANALSLVKAGAGRVEVLPHVLATLAAVIGLGFLLGRAFKYLGQPPVIGEVIAGIVLGPSLLGTISPDAMHWLIPDAAADPGGHVKSALKMIAQLGVILYMFLVGLELNGAKLKHQAHATIAVSHASIVVPFVLGAALALPLYPILSHRGVPFTSFALFLGAAMSVTAFPVLARILADRGLEKSEIGVLALGCAAADDVTAWCLLAFVVGVAQSKLEEGFGVIAGAMAFILVMFFVVRPLLKRLAKPQGVDRHLSPGSARERSESKPHAAVSTPGEGAGTLHPLTRRADAERMRTATSPPQSRGRGEETLHPMAIPATFVVVLLCALATEVIGIHAVFGAFLLGAVIPHDSILAREFTRRMKDVVTVLLLPAFFALAGLQTDIRLMGSGQSVLICLAIIAAATLGKFGGTFVAAKLAGRDSRTSAALGAMMNTRGLMGLIVLDIGLNLGIISPELFAMMVVMAIVTTLATAPALKRLVPSNPV